MKGKWLFRIASILIVVFLMALVGPVQASTRHRHRHNPEAGKRKALKRIGIGTAIGAGAGGIIGGRKGAAIGASMAPGQARLITTTRSANGAAVIQVSNYSDSHGQHVSAGKWAGVDYPVVPWQTGTLREFGWQTINR